METKKKLSGVEKFAYGIGAVGKDMVYMLSASYILYYYQDIMGVSAWIMGIILLVARVFDAFNDPIMGVIVAKTKSRWGKFRPWLFIGTLTNAIILYLMFACPPTLKGSGLVAYAACFYILWGVTYTMMDIPYWSMVPAFTESGKEREGLSALARTCAGVGSAIVTIVTVLAVTNIGSAISAKSANNQDLTVSNSICYVMEKDDAGVADGEVTVFSDVLKDVKITADKSEFENEISFSQDNSNYDIVLNSVSLDKNNSEMNIVMDSAESDTASIALYVDKETYNKINAGEGQENSASIVSTKEVERIGYKYFSLAVAIVFFAFILITCLCIKEKSSVDMKTASVGEMFSSLIHNDQAMTMVITIVLVNTATYITSNLLIYFFKYDLAGSNWTGNYTLFNTFGGGIQILAMMLFFPLLRKFFNIMKVFYICVFSAIGGYVILLIMALSGIATVYPFLVPGFFIMAAVGMLNVIVTVFLANTVDYGELKNGRRDESVIFSMQTFVVKLASGVAALVASICLSIFHISESDNAVNAVNGSLAEGMKKMVDDIIANGASVVSGNSVIGLRMTMTIVPIVVLFIAFFIFKKKYILTDERLLEITKELQDKKNRGTL
ncbi:MFS transporter [Agathobacter sp.]|uniref:MFS transporter n=1 Tax=Agathobacter sp. TaxID=2021311 RepID=UPI002ED2EAE6